MWNDCAIIGDGPEEQSSLANPSLEEEKERLSAPPRLPDRRRLPRHPAFGHRVQPSRIPHHQVQSLGNHDLSMIGLRPVDV